MGYDKENYWEKVRQVQQITREYQKRGYFNEWIYRELIKPKFLIGRTTFYSYLAVNPYLERIKREKRASQKGK